MPNRTIIYSGEHAAMPWVWEIHSQGEDGLKGMHLMPKSALDFRAAEYGIDPTDVDTLVGMLLAEVHMPTPEQEQLDPALKAKAKPHIWGANTTDEARANHLDRVKNCVVKYQVKGSKGLDAIRQGHAPNPEFIQIYRQVVDVFRWTEKYGDLPTPPKAHKSITAEPFQATGMKVQLPEPPP